MLPENTDPDLELNYIDISGVDSTGHVVSVEPHRFETAPSRARRLPRNGDTIVSTVRTYLKAIAHIEGDKPGLVCSTGFAVLTPGSTIDPRFLYYWVRSERFIEEICARSVGVSYPTINALEIGSLPVPLLSCHEQRAIAAFLDRKTAAIDALISKKERLVEALDERQDALITQAVTKGLDPAVEMKESGIEWLGQIPCHWVVTKLRRIAKRVDVGIAESATHAYVDSGVPLLRSTNVSNGRYGADDLLYLDRAFADGRPSKYLRAGDLLTVRTGDAGATAVVPAELDHSHCFTMLMTTLRPEMNPEYYCSFLNSRAGRIYFSLESWGSAQANISVPILGNMPVPELPTAEQVRIAGYVRSVTRANERVIEAVQEQIRCLQEYRQAVITAAVTGKLSIPADEAA